jgi:hypothetical protein
VRARHSFHKAPGLGVGARRDQVPVLGIEQKDQAQEDRQQTVIDVVWPARGKIFDPRAIRGMKPTQQLMKGTENLRRKLCRDFGLGVATGLQERRKAPVRRVIMQAKRG